MCSNDASGDAVSEELTAWLARLEELANTDTVPGDVSDAVRIDRITVLERARAALAAAQHTEMVAFARSQAASQIADDRVDPEKVGRGIADQVALARRVSPTVGSRGLEVARALWAELPELRTLLAAGRISERLAEIVVSQTNHLDHEQRRLVDKQLAGDGLDRMSRKEAEAAVRRRAYEVDRAGYVARGRKARADRRVTLRPAPDTMAWLTLLLPVEQGAQVMGVLGKHADTHGGVGEETRTRDQIMVDTAVERLTGRASAEDVDVEVNLVIPWDALADPETCASSGEGTGSESAAADADVPAPRPSADPHADPSQPARGPSPGSTGAARTAELIGYGPIPMAIARDILASSGGRLWWRRLFARPGTGPDGGPVIGGDPRRRRFDRFLAHLLGIRDHGRCRDPWCDAPIRHYDHIRQSRAGGPTVLANGRGVCARGNYVREMPDWRIEVIDDGLGATPHTVRTTTPTGHTYTSRADP